MARSFLGGVLGVFLLAACATEDRPPISSDSASDGGSSTGTAETSASATVGGCQCSIEHLGLGLTWPCGYSLCYSDATFTCEANATIATLPAAACPPSPEADAGTDDGGVTRSSARSAARR